MVSSLQSIVSSVRPQTSANPLQGAGSRIANAAALGDQRRAAKDSASRQMKKEELVFLNRLGKTMLETGEEQWPGLVSPYGGILSELGIDPSKIADLSKSELSAFVSQSNALIDSEKSDMSVGQSERNELFKDLEEGIDSSGKLKPISQLTAKQRAAAIALDIIPGAGTTTKDERVAESSSLTNKVARSKSAISAAIKTATKKAELKGEAISDLNVMNAALPGLKEVVKNLKDLTPFATSTLGGKFFDGAVKEAGFGATKGATARAKYIAIIDNQILPLLRQTFGAAFTKGEGDRLRATLGNPDTTADAKNAQLDAFMESKIRQIETKEREVEGMAQEDYQPAKSKAQADTVNWSDLK